MSEPRASTARSVRTGQAADRWLWLLTFALVGSGLIMVFSASQALAYVQHGFTLYYFLRQALFAGLGLIAMVVLARYDYHRLRKHAPLLAAAAALLMLLVLVPGLGISVNGARRWFSLGPLSAFQPSELGKLAFAVYIAHWVAKRGDRLRSLADGFLPLAIMLAFVLGVLMLQRDLGTAMITCSIFIAVYFAGGGRKGHLLLLVALLLAAFLLLITFESYRSQRLGAFLDPFKDPLGVGFQSSQGLLALGSGGLTGVGLGHSIQKYSWLPAAHTDFIFAIVGEETGLLGTTALLGAFTLLGIRGYRVAMRAADRFGMALATGITTWIVFQALLNMGTVTDTIPVTGVPLPFISYGGSALAICMAAIGVLLNISRQGEDQPHLRRRLDATLDLGRRHRRSPVPGARRRSSVPR
ncbi:MAG: putative lipid II flippase FtsW [Candidatus Dormibacter sp.]|uniref:putative lipid II flippase FtsW n=1 Tax=Candidatus Dormibacter sp. TaxID=2973982 RepID=UPI000DB6795D|nr:MAG: putative lipid II flippase FtsW [Candidatus Dormibacteraeota bacterium]